MVLEALACGLPVVATICPGGVGEILEDGRWGLLVPREQDALTEALATALTTPSPRESLREPARALTVDRAVDQYLEVLRDHGQQAA